MPRQRSVEATERAAAARRFLIERGDASLGLAPQAFMTSAQADAWSCFWAAARRIDDALDAPGTAAPTTWQQAVRRDGQAEEDLAAFAASLGPKRRHALESRYDAAWDAMRARHAWTRAPAPGAYVASCATMAGLPMRAYYAILGHDPEAAAAFADVLGAAIQVGDDARDAAEDRAAGLHVLSRADASDAPALTQQRTRLCAWLLARAIRLGQACGVADSPAALAPIVLWHHAIRSGQVAPTTRPLDLGPETSRAVRAAAARPEEALGILHQDLVARAQGLDAWAAACAEAAVEFVGEPGH